MLLTTLLVVATLAGTPDGSQTDPGDVGYRVRAIDKLSNRLLLDGLHESPTIASEVRRLMRSDVVVYITTGPNLKLTGELTFMTHAGGLTYVLIRVHPMLTGIDRLVALGHELQHACEIADAGDQVTDERTLAALYQKIGFQTGPQAFESAGAQAASASVRREVWNAIRTGGM